MASADDVVILVGSKFLSTLWELMEPVLEILSSWATNCGLTLNPNKTDFDLLPCRYNIETFRLQWLCGRELLLSSEVKYLEERMED